MRAVIPYKKENAKSRLSSVLDLHEREEFVELMLKDVFNTLRSAGIENIDVLTTSRASIAPDLDVGIIENEKGLNEAINQYLASIDEPVLIAMADLPLLAPCQVMDITEKQTDVVIVPGKGGGTNIIRIMQPSRFHVKYYGSSFLNHYAIAQECGMSVHVYDSFRASTDIDEPQDLVELLVHGSGLAKEYIKERFSMRSGKGRVAILSDTCRIASE
ncbi:2-phospho-L-lactate guanylyltransferase CofC [Methanosalsum zhilinae DSM 4017]|uniref:2-phospho-L-lactate guanylyltransferase n=1 Tax=Methanosalsum zhilinae (strain DSM 4017 / NBRC 107636 / OCM 62 / WeN5) TaxID=679901 RepID=F7XPL2_METZD|nr:2-phospho-L-lactate guanylyltransferase [Methanosalsum zhilinae]AEH61444.1 2-phospho-L-lactate guanylyltransferase CofC [Methanosalsum zhilinae DSM 4017]